MVSPFQRHAKVFQDKRFNDAYNAYMGIGKKKKKEVDKYSNSDSNPSRRNRIVILFIVFVVVAVRKPALAAFAWR